MKKINYTIAALLVLTSFASSCKKDKNEPEQKTEQEAVAPNNLSYDGKPLSIKNVYWNFDTFDQASLNYQQKSIVITDGLNNAVSETIDNASYLAIISVQSKDKNGLLSTETFNWDSAAIDGPGQIFDILFFTNVVYDSYGDIDFDLSDVVYLENTDVMTVEVTQHSASHTIKFNGTLEGKPANFSYTGLISEIVE